MKKGGKMKKQIKPILVPAVMVAFICTGLFLPGLIGAGKLDPGKAPAPTMHTLDETGDDGDLEKGVAWPDPRFIDKGDDTVTDNLTGLIWLKKANCIQSGYPSFDTDGTEDGRVTWQHALDFVAGINNGTYPDCGGGYTDWRLPNVKELNSLIDLGEWNPTLSSDHPFTGLVADRHWSSTTSTYGSGEHALYVSWYYGVTNFLYKWNNYFVWPVRGGQ
jgi:hypothetical protein